MNEQEKAHYGLSDNPPNSRRNPFLQLAEEAEESEPFLSSTKNDDGSNRNTESNVSAGLEEVGDAQLVESWLELQEPLLEEVWDNPDDNDAWDDL